ncbi:hypothetical protein TcG_12862 [Trypanosoma cruzi]|nr:hypothetical protein TcG_12862 [Trypanosoma cruzi]
MPGTWASLHCSQATELEGCPGGKGRRTHRVTGVFLCGEDSIPAVDPDIGPEWRHRAQARCDSRPLLDRPARALRITRSPLCRWCLPFFTEETCPPLPELLPDVSAATHCPQASGGWKSSCPTCGRARFSIHNVRAHARRARPGVPMV